MSMKALESQTAKLPSVEILKPPSIIGRSTVESIQSGIYFGQIQMVKGVTEEIIKEQQWTGKDRPLLIATGGFSNMFEDSRVFDKIIPDLALKGLYYALKMNN